MSTGRAEACQLTVPGDGSAALRLQARLFRGERGYGVVAPPHPLYGGTIDNAVVLRIVEGLARAKFGALTFNYRGVEQSEGKATDDLACAVADYTAAIERAVELVGAPVICAGYSFGAGTALLAARDDTRVSTLVLVSPPVGMLRGDDLRAFAGRVLCVIGDDDEYAPLAQLSAVLAARPDAILEVIRGADHFFHFGGLSEIAARISSHLPAVTS